MPTRFRVVCLALGLVNAGAANAQNEAQVCFYEDAEFAGASYCAAPGFDTPDADDIHIDGARQSWNKRISSIQIRGSAKVTIWEGKDFTGPSLVLTRSEPDLGAVKTADHGVRNWDNAVSSYKTHY